MVASEVVSKHGILPTPALPADLPKVDLTENARQVLLRRYVRRGDDGLPAETVEEMFWRVAYHVAKAEETWGGEVLPRAREFYGLLTSKKFFPNSPTFTGAGTPLGQLAACFVLPINDDMGRDEAGIFQSLRNAALIQQTGGGNGFSFSRLRPKGGLVKSSAGQATGPVGFLRVYDHAFGEIAQGGCLVPETLIFTSNGLLRLDELVDVNLSGWQDHQMQVATDQGWHTSPRGYNNGVAPVLRVHTRQGVSLAGTVEHRVKVMTDDGPQWRKLNELQKGDWIIVQTGQQRGKLQALRQPARVHGNQNWPSLPPVLDEEMAFFAGILTGDGFVAAQQDDHRVGVSVSHTSYLMQEMPELLGRLFGVKVHCQQKENDRSVTFVIDNRAVKEFLEMNGLGKERSRLASVPRLIRQSPPEVVGAFLRGLFEADGGLSHGYPDLSTTSARLAEEVAALLIGLGCPVRVRSVMPGINHYGNAAVYHIRIESTQGLQAWRTKVGCDARSRFAVCMAWESDLRRESTFVLPNPRYWLQPVLDAITLEQIDRQGRGTGRKFRSINPALRRSLLRYMRDERSFTLSAYATLAQEYAEFAEHAVSPVNQWFVEVLGVEPAGESLTLDLEVDENHTYLAYGMVTHNTRRGANMGVLRVDHPDVEDFITSKISENAITNFNISVGITDAFMQAVKDDADWDLVFPDISVPEYRQFRGTLEQAREKGIPVKVYKTVRAREIFNQIVKQAHHNGEPGVLFLDAANRQNPVPHLYPLESTNPCFVGETRIATDQGLLTIEELTNSGAALLVASDGRAPYEGIGLAGNIHGIAYREASPAWKTHENVETLKLTTKHGYTITATPDHKFLTAEHGYVELGQLQPGETLLLQSGEGVWSRNTRLPNIEMVKEKLAVMGQGGDRASGHLITRQDFSARYANLPESWSHELGVVLGTLVGDGWLSPSSNSPVGMVFNSSDDELLETVHGTLRSWFGEGHLHERGSVRQLTYGRLPYEFFRTLGVSSARAHEKQVPAVLWQAPREAVVGFLQGLFTTDGTVNLSSHKKSCSVRLASASLEMLREVQLLLLNFGIVSRIHKRRPAGMRSMPDGKGGLKDYFTQADYELILDKANRDQFAREIGFLNQDKQNKLAQFISSKTRLSNAETFETTVLSVEPSGMADVYDLTEPQTHSVIANGIVAHQCGEQWLGPFENCCLGSVNLAQHLGLEGTVDWETLRQSVVLSTLFLDDVVEANAYVPAVPQLKEAALRARRIGLGIMGLGDLMYHVGARYGSDEGQEFAAQVMEFIRYHAMKTSLEMAAARGAFPAIAGSIYDPQALRWSPPQPLSPYQGDWARPVIDWETVVEGIKKVGIRNAAQTTVAPTGTIATVAGCEGYGCEPVFALAYIRHVNDNGQDLRLTYGSPLFEQALEEAGIDTQSRQEIFEEVMKHGTCQDVPAVPEDVRRVFVTAGDVSAEEHVRMAGALQAFVDNSISKTINFPEGASEEEVAKAYMLAWELGAKGITVYVTGSRDKVVLETHATAGKKQAPAKDLVLATEPLLDQAQKLIWHETKKPRPRALHGKTYTVDTPLGKAFVTVNANGGEQPFEVFINTSKAGSDTAAVSEAIGRLISYVLRLASPIAPVDRLREVVTQLTGIGGGRSLGFGPHRVRSLPDGVGQVLDEYLRERDGEPKGHELVSPPAGTSGGNPQAGGNGHRPAVNEPPSQPLMKIGDLCPECGEAAVVNEEGCRKCYACGFSEC